MKRNFISQRASTVVGALLVIGGAVLAGWAVGNLPAGLPSPANAGRLFQQRSGDSPLAQLPVGESGPPSAMTELADSPLIPGEVEAASDSEAETQSLAEIFTDRLTETASSSLTEPITTAVPSSEHGDLISPTVPGELNMPAELETDELETGESETDDAGDSVVPVSIDREAGPETDITPQLVIAAAADLPVQLSEALVDLDRAESGVEVVTHESVSATVGLSWQASGGVPFYRQYFAAATRFDTLDTSLTQAALDALWLEPSARFARVVYLAETEPALESLLGAPGAHVEAAADVDSVIEAAWSMTPTLALLPFEMLHPRLTVLAIDGQNPVENANRFDAGDYALTALVYIEGRSGSGQLDREQAALLRQLPNTNREPNRLTVVAATGVTAMTRNMAAEMETRGYSWPAEVVGPELAAADITIISNEVPFVEDCEPNTAPDNLVFCSKPEYMQTLLDSGVTIVGLTGNHQNDFGWRGMAASLDVYAEYGIPVYGGGLDVTQATAPLYMEHNGNRLAFLGVNSFGPPSAWATATNPGSAPYDLTLLSGTIRTIKEQDLADLVLAEFQYLESYDVTPLGDQVIDFRAVVRAGADIVTGVQSHVPQGMEFFNPLPAGSEDVPASRYSGDRLILYGLGNLYFDQMWTEPTRDNLFVKHTIYAGRHLSTQIFVTVLHDYGQPRWADPVRRAAILERVFGASTFSP